MFPFDLAPLPFRVSMRRSGTKMWFLATAESTRRVLMRRHCCKPARRPEIQSTPPASLICSKLLAAKSGVPVGFRGSWRIRPEARA